MTETVQAILRQPFAAQVAAFRLRLGNLVPTSRWDDISRSMHDSAFMVSGATKAELLADLAAAIDKAIVEGTGLEEFRRDFREIVERHGGNLQVHSELGAGATFVVELPLACASEGELPRPPKRSERTARGTGSHPVVAANDEASADLSGCCQIRKRVRNRRCEDKAQTD